jgi:hypothetical protein
LNEKHKNSVMGFNINRIIDFMTIGNQSSDFIDFDFVELGAAKINLLPPRLRVAATAEHGWGLGK